MSRLLQQISLSRLVVSLATMLLSVAVVAQEPASGLQQALTVGAYFAAGDYGEATDTEILYLPLSYEANMGKLGFQLLVPHLRVTGSGSVLINIGGVTRAVAGTQEATARGIGDSVASLIYRFDPLTETAPFIDFRFDVKIPSADETRSLGTGETDYSMQLDFTQLLGRTVAFASLGYNFRGKSDLFEGLEDSAFVQLGFAQPLSTSWNLGVYYDYRERASAFLVESHELVPYLSWQIDQHWTFSGLLTRGFTEASADTSVFAQLRFDF